MFIFRYISISITHHVTVFCLSVVVSQLASIIHYNSQIKSDVYLTFRITLSYSVKMINEVKYDPILHV